jgi:hypothetical protein
MRTVPIVLYPAIFYGLQIVLWVVVVVSDFGIFDGIEAYCRGHEG